MTRPSTLVLLACLCGVLVPANEATACTCISLGPACSADARAAAVFVGRVMSATGSVEFEVERAISGVGLGRVTIENEQSNCAADLRVGERYVVYAYKDPSNGALTTSLCTRTRPLSDPRTRSDLALFYWIAAPNRVDGLVTGQVADATPPTPMIRSSRGVPAARVTVTAAGGRRLNTDTREDGTFELYGVPVGDAVVAIDLPRDYQPVPSQRITIDESARCAEATFLTRVDGAIRGQLLDEGGRPVRSVHTQLVEAPRADADSTRPLLDVLTDEQGYFEFDGVGSGQYLVAIDAWGAPRPGRRDHRRFLGARSDPSKPVVLELGRAEQRDVGALQLAPLPSEREITVVISAPSPQIAAQTHLFLIGATRQPVQLTGTSVTMRLPFGAAFLLEAVAPPGYMIVGAKQLARVRVERDETDRTIEFRVERQ
jgi:hypothetical protein